VGLVGPLTVLHLPHRVRERHHVPLQPCYGSLLAEHRIAQRAHLGRGLRQLRRVGGAALGGGRQGRPARAWLQRKASE
jgi:hypothetical protein